MKKEWKSLTRSGSGWESLRRQLIPSQYYCDNVDDIHSVLIGQNNLNSIVWEIFCGRTLLVSSLTKLSPCWLFFKWLLSKHSNCQIVDPIEDCRLITHAFVVQPSLLVKLGQAELGYRRTALPVVREWLYKLIFKLTCFLFSPAGPV